MTDMRQPMDRYCARCQRPNPEEEGSVPSEWEALIDSDGDVFVVCDDCLTPEEQQAMDEEDMTIHDEAAGLAGHCARCLKSVPYASDDPGAQLPSGWELLDHDEDVLLVVCPDCIRPDDELVR